MGYSAVQADASNIHEFKYPLLAHIKQPGEQYLHIVEHINDWEKQKEIVKHWSGITLYPENNTLWVNDKNNLYEKETLKKLFYTIAFLSAGLGLLAVSVFYIADIATITLGFLSLIGLITSVFLLGTGLGYQSQIVKQVCGAVSNGGCEKVLNSNYAKGLLGITPADVSLIYFSTQFIVYLLATIYPDVLPVIFLLTFFGIPVAAWSIYTQAAKVKQWCALCLGVAGVLILQTIVGGKVFSSHFFNMHATLPGLIFIVTFILFTIALLPIKQLIKINNTNKLQLSELKKWKTDAALFITQWKNEPACDTIIWQNDLIIGNPTAPILITVACNPYCGPCAEAHLQLDDLLHRFSGKIKVQVRLLCNTEVETDMRTIAVKAILQKAAFAKNNNELQELLADWFAWMNFEKWNTKWKPAININVEEMMQKHVVWINENQIAFTPTFFINGRKLPGRYSLKDVELLIPQLAEILAEK